MGQIGTKIKQLCLHLTIFGQLITPFYALPPDTTVQIDTQFERYFSTFALQSHLQINWRLSPLRLWLRNRYSGTTTLGTVFSTRDENTLEARFHWQFHPQWNTQTRANFWIVKDSRSLPLHQRLQFTVLPGLQWQPATLPFTLWTGGGIAFAAQQAIEEYAPTLATDAAAQWFWKPYQLHLQSSALWSWFPQRQNGSWQTALSIATGTGPNALRLDAGATVARRDYFIAFPQTPILPVEQRWETHYRTAFELRYQLSSNIHSMLRAGFTLSTTDRTYNRHLTQFPETALRRSLSRQRSFLHLTLSAMPLPTLHLLLRFLYRYNADDESAQRGKFPISAIELQRWQQRANFMDFQQSHRELSLQLRLHPGVVDSLHLQGTIALTRYDTPSALNVDDRDELRWNAAAHLYLRSSPHLRVGIAAGIHFHHFIYLKAARSAQNYREYQLHFIPTIQWIIPHFTLNAQFFVTSHYVIYDFEQLSQSPRSYSIRQIGYRDSIRWQMNRQMHVLLLPTIRYQERGILFWNQFAELPELRTYEHEIILLLYRKLFATVAGGIGFRWFQRIQHSQRSSPSQHMLILGPQLDWHFTVANGSQLWLRGWYELHWINGTLVLHRPQLRIESKVHL